MKSCEIDPWTWHQGGQPTDEVQRTQHDMGSAGATRRRVEKLFPSSDRKPSVLPDESIEELTHMHGPGSKRTLRCATAFKIPTGVVQLALTYNDGRSVAAVLNAAVRPDPSGCNAHITYS